MMILVWLLTIVLVLDCLLLTLLVLVQLPKKEAGAGLAFGGGATDALFGAGSGNALTKITKYAAGVFFVLAIVLSAISGSMNKGRVSAVEEKLKEKASQAPAGVPGASQPSSAPLVAPSSSTVTPTAPSAPIEAPAATTPESTTPAAVPVPDAPK